MNGFKSLEKKCKRKINKLSVLFLLRLLRQRNGPFRTSVAIKIPLRLSLWYTVSKVLSIIDKSLTTTSTNRVLGRPRSLVLFILLTNTFLIGCPLFYLDCIFFTRLLHSTLVCDENSWVRRQRSWFIYIYVWTYV